tara:strand:- start:672 stop:851 length:180 start_codon:yes stop_codon:yes gene_type:complete
MIIDPPEIALTPEQIESDLQAEQAWYDARRLTEGDVDALAEEYSEGRNYRRGIKGGLYD